MDENQVDAVGVTNADDNDPLLQELVNIQGNAYSELSGIPDIEGVGLDDFNDAYELLANFRHNNPFVPVIVPGVSRIYQITGDTRFQIDVPKGAKVAKIRNSLGNGFYYISINGTAGDTPRQLPGVASVTVMEGAMLCPKDDFFYCGNVAQLDCFFEGSGFLGVEFYGISARS